MAKIYESSDGKKMTVKRTHPFLSFIGVVFLFFLAVASIKSNPLSLLVIIPVVALIGWGLIAKYNRGVAAKAKEERTGGNR